jgi:hypothetical protein
LIVRAPPSAREYITRPSLLRSYTGASSLEGFRNW